MAFIVYSKKKSMAFCLTSQIDEISQASKGSNEGDQISHNIAAISNLRLYYVHVQHLNPSSMLLLHSLSWVIGFHFLFGYPWPPLSLVGLYSFHLILILLINKLYIIQF